MPHCSQPPLGLDACSKNVLPRGPNAYNSLWSPHVLSLWIRSAPATVPSESLLPQRAPHGLGAGWRRALFAAPPISDGLVPGCSDDEAVRRADLRKRLVLVSKLSFAQPGPVAQDECCAARTERSLRFRSRSRLAAGWQTCRYVPLGNLCIAPRRRQNIRGPRVLIQGATVCWPRPFRERSPITRKRLAFRPSGPARRARRHCFARTGSS